MEGGREGVFELGFDVGENDFFLSDDYVSCLKGAGH